MAETIARIYLSAYETNQKLGKMLIPVFFLIFLVPFVALELASLGPTTDTISIEKPNRIQGVLDMGTTGERLSARKDNPNWISMADNRPMRIQGVWNMRKSQTVPPVRSGLKPMSDDRPMRIKGVWNMRMGGVL